MKRFFTKNQKLTLANFANWKCQICGEPLSDSFHADHIIPFSKGGSTDVCNGQALCPTCNLSKGNKMGKKIKLRDWQEEACEIIMKRTRKDKFETLIHATPGGGKTWLGLHTWKQLKKKYGYTHLLVIVPSDLLRMDWIEDASSNFNIPLSDGIIFAGQDKFSQFEGVVTTYATIHSQVGNYRNFCNNYRVLVIADEVHHVSIKEQAHSKWGASFEEAVSPAEKLVMLTGTPWTTKGDPIPFTSPKKNGDGYVKTHYTYTKARAIKDGVCRDSIIRPQKDVESLTNKTTGEVYDDFDAYTKGTGKDGYIHAVSNPTNMITMFRQGNAELNRLRDMGQHNASGLLVAPSIESAHLFADKIEKITGVKPMVVSTRDGNDKMDNSNRKKIKAFTEGTSRWIISVNMISEGIDIKKLQVLVFMSNAKTELYFRQVMGRVERRMNKNEADKTCYVYYISHPKLDAWVSKINDENSQGVAMRDIVATDEFAELEGNGDGGTNENDFVKDDIEIIMKDIQEYIVHNGIDVNEAVINEMTAIVANNNAYSRLPHGILILMAEANINERESNTTTESTGIPIIEQERILRSQLKPLLGRQVRKIGVSDKDKVFSIANNILNKMVGIASQNTASVDKLQAKYDLMLDLDAWSHELIRQVA